MAPSLHLRPKTSVALLLSAALALSACGSVQQPGAAAIVNGTAISDQDLQTVSRQLDSINPDGQKSPPSELLIRLIVARFVLAEAERAHKTISVAKARTAIPQLADPAPATITLVQMQEVVPKLDQASKDSIDKEIRNAKITFNPRYGTFDPIQGVVPNSPNWIKTSPTPSAR